MSLQELAKMGAAPVGAFAAAWLGAHFGFRKARKERALDRIVAWHVDTIQALSRYEERIKRLHGYSRNVLVIQRARNMSPAETGADLPRTVRVPEKLWQDLREAEESARAALRLADAYTDLPTQVECSSALRSTVNIVSDQWFDISPEPEVAWAGWSSNAIRVSSLLTLLQRSHRTHLEIDGLISSRFASVARFLLLRRLRKVQKGLARRAS